MANVRSAQEKADKIGMGIVVAFNDYTTLVQPNLPRFTDKDLRRKLSLANEFLEKKDEDEDDFDISEVLKLAHILS